MSRLGRAELKSYVLSENLWRSKPDCQTCVKQAVYKEQRAMVPTLIPEGPQSLGVVAWMRCCLQQQPKICQRCINTATEGLNQRFQKLYAVSLKKNGVVSCVKGSSYVQQGENGDTSLISALKQTSHNAVHTCIQSSDRSYNKDTCITGMCTHTHTTAFIEHTSCGYGWHCSMCFTQKGGVQAPHAILAHK